MSIFDRGKPMDLSSLWKRDPREFAKSVQRLTEQTMRNIRPEKRESLRQFHEEVGVIFSNCKNDGAIREKMMELLKNNVSAHLGALSKLHVILSQVKNGPPTHGLEPQKKKK